MFLARRYCTAPPTSQISLNKLRAIRYQSNMSTAATTSASFPTRRSPVEIQKLIQQRVDERRSWIKVGPTEPTWEDIRELWKNVPPNPSTEGLDETFPIQRMDWHRIQSPPKDKIQLTWLGHASLLIQMGGWNILSDPVLSDRCSPSQWFGPKRFRPPPCHIQELVHHISIDAVLISHNHYDHLDYHTCTAIARQQPQARWFVPLGLQEWFLRHVSKRLMIYEQDWHESVQIDGGDVDDSSKSRLVITAVPMRHWSSRLGLDRDKSLWCGFVINDTTQNKKMLFPGDTSWFDGLETIIGRDYGTFDVAAIPIGAYEPRNFMKYAHINVPEAVMMKDAVRAKEAVPIHWGTFPMTTEPILEPRDLLLELMKDRADRHAFVPWLIGETKQFGTTSSN